MVGDLVVLLRFIFLIVPLLSSAQIENFQWPLAPVDQQHRISATFDECREDRDHFHNGTDMPLAPGGNVLNIQAGQVTGIGSDWIRVEDFAYVHVIVNSALDVGETISKGAIVGVTDSYAHIHLNYGGGASGHPTSNPLLPGKLTPFSDPYHPRSPLIQLVKDGTLTQFQTNKISGRVDIIAQAADTTDLQSTIDMNNGVYKIGWGLYQLDKKTPMAGPYFWFEAKQLYANSYINNVYAKGSSTSIYKYIVTNKVYSNGFLNCSAYPEGEYFIAVMSADTRNNWDTTFVAVTLSAEDVIAPAAPLLNYVGPDSVGNIHLEWTGPPDEDLAGYRLEFSQDGQNWSSNHGPDVLTPDLTEYTFEDIPDGIYLKFRMAALDNAPEPNMSEYSDTYAVRVQAAGERFLIVDGFDRTNGSWTRQQHDFACSYSDAIVATEVEGSITTANNEWTLNQLDLSDYNYVFWFLGDDSRTLYTFNSAEQVLITNFLDGGGKLFASGAEIGYDLSVANNNFLNNVLKIDYAGDNAGSYEVTGAGAYFDGYSCSYGSTPYVEDWPDYFDPLNGGEAILKYGNGRTAAVAYRDGSRAIVTLGFTFETINTAAARSHLLARALGYFRGTTDIDNKQIPVTSSMISIYPNPFNASLSVKYRLVDAGYTEFKIFNLLGQQVYSEGRNHTGSGSFVWTWQAADHSGAPLTSGTYILHMSHAGTLNVSRKLLLLR